tara:strand:+ start:1867 stop:2226 length:360 start_codon:yes stop_codon:yes gene_type:complete
LHTARLHLAGKRVACKPKGKQHANGPGKPGYCHVATFNFYSVRGKDFVANPGRRACCAEPAKPMAGSRAGLAGGMPAQQQTLVFAAKMHRIRPARTAGSFFAIGIEMAGFGRLCQPTAG